MDMRMHPIASRKNLKNFPAQINIRAGKKSAVGFPAADSFSAFLARFFHARYDIGRANARLGLQEIFEHAAIHGIVATDGDDYGVGPQIFSDDHAHAIAAEETNAAEVLGPPPYVGG